MLKINTINKKMLVLLVAEVLIYCNYHADDVVVVVVVELLIYYLYISL